MTQYLGTLICEELGNKRDQILMRFLEILPGFLSLSSLFLSFLGSIFFPKGIAIFIICFGLFWVFKVFYLTYFQIISLKKIEKNLKTDWLKKIEKFKNWREIYHLLLLPVCSEDEKIISRTLNSLLKVNYPKENLIVVLSFEACRKENLKIAKIIKEKYKNLFKNFFITFHPENLPFEIRGRGANINWAANFAKKIIEKLGIKKENVICSNFDIDTRPYPDYFLVLTFNYLEQKNKENIAFQPIPLYLNNAKRAMFLSKIVAFSSTFWQMIQQEREKQLITFSSHSLPFLVMEKVGYPKEIIPDDSRIFWKAFFYYKGDFKVLPLHYPVLMDSVEGKNFFETIKNLYKQQRRWAWGVTEIPYIFFNFIKRKEIPLSKKIWYGAIVLEGFWSWATAAFLIFFLGWLPIVLGGVEFNKTIFSFNLPKLMGNLMTIGMIGLFVSAKMSLYFLKLEKKKLKISEKIKEFLSWLFLPFCLIFFGAVPALEAQLRLIFKKYLEFETTPKYENF
jgi:hypothetical protein